MPFLNSWPEVVSFSTSCSLSLMPFLSFSWRGASLYWSVLMPFFSSSW